MPMNIRDRIGPPVEFQNEERDGYDIAYAANDDYQIAYSYCNEGYRGDFDPDDPDDEQLLRITLYEAQTCRAQVATWESIESCCTQMPKWAPMGKLHQILKETLAQIDPDPNTRRVGLRRLIEEAAGKGMYSI